MSQHRAQSRHAPFPSTRLNPTAHLAGSQTFAAMVDRCFDVVSKTGDEWACYCPFHHNVHSPAMSVNVSTGMYCCYNPSCGAQGGPSALRRFCGEKTGTDGESELADVRERLRMLTRHVGQDEQLPARDESMLNRFNAVGTPYWKDRGFSQEIIEAFDLGYDPMEDHAIIPIRNRHGELLGVIRRDLDPDAGTKGGSQKYLYPHKFKKSREMFASWYAEHTDSHELVLVEGAVDCMMVWQAGFACMAQYGSRISPEQIRMIRRMGFTRVVLFFDDDAAGHAAVDAALGQTTRIRYGRPRKDYDPATDLRHGFLVHRVTYRKSWPKDPGAMDTTDIATAVISAKRVT